MNSSLLKIDLSRFESGKILSRDVFLFMPLNGKYVRLASVGDEFRPELLARLIARSISTLHVAGWKENEDPLTCQLYVNGESDAAMPESQLPPPAELDHADTAATLSGSPEASPSPSGEPGAPLNIQESPQETHQKISQQNSEEDPSDEVKVEAVKEEADGTKNIENSLDPQDGKKTRKLKLVANDEPQSLLSEKDTDKREVIPSSPAEIEPESRFSPSKELPEETTTIGGSLASEEAVQVISPLRETLEDVIQIVAAESEASTLEAIKGLRNSLEESLTKLKSVEPADLEQTIIAADAAVQEAVQIFKKQSEQSDSDKQLSTELLAAVEHARDQISGATQKLSERSEQKASSHYDAENFEHRFSAEKIVKDQTEIHRSKREPVSDDSFETMTIKKQKKKENDPELPAASPSEMEKLEANQGRPPLSKGRNGLAALFDEAKKIQADSIGKDSAGPISAEKNILSTEPPKDSLIAEKHPAKELSTTSAAIANGDASSNEAPAEQRDESKSNDSYSSNLRSATFKDLPATASRMAAHLAHSLGYASPDFLSDLALATALYFSRKEGIHIQDGIDKPLLNAVLQHTENSNDSVIEDSLEIILFLETYFSAPSCDRSMRDFSRKVVREAFADLKSHPTGISSWNEVRWTQYVDQGPSIGAQSLCNKASASALKATREFTA